MMYPSHNHNNNDGNEIDQSSVNRRSGFKIKSVRVTSFKSDQHSKAQVLMGENGHAMTCSRTYTVKSQMSAAKILINKENMKMFSSSLSSSVSSSIVSSISSSLVSVKLQGLSSDFHSQILFQLYYICLLSCMRVGLLTKAYFCWCWELKNLNNRFVSYQIVFFFRLPI